jgi:hypothetical protein
MHNRQPITPKLLWKSMCDYDLWLLYLIGLTFQIPETTPAQYLTQTLKGLGFGTFKTNLLVIPSTVFHMITMLALTYVAEIWGELTLTSAFGQIWALPFLIYIYLVDITKINKWKAFSIMSLLLSYPSGKTASYSSTFSVYNNTQRIQFKSPGTLAIQMQSVLEPSRQPCTTCSSKLAVSSLQMYTAPTMHHATNVAIALWSPSVLGISGFIL